MFIAAAKVFTALSASPRQALALVCALSGALLVTATALLAREVAAAERRRLVDHLAGALAAVSPFLWLSSEKLMSDMPGAALTTWALWLCARARRLETDGNPARAAHVLRTAALLLLGLGLGVRLSYFPVAIACFALIVRREGGLASIVARGRDLAVGVLVWLVPLIIAVPPRELVGTTLVQGAGHFTRWGGTAITVSSPWERLHGAVWGLWANVLGGAWPDAPASRWIAAPILIVFLAFAVRSAGTAQKIQKTLRAQPELWASALAYFGWALLGQNTVYKPRHWLPLAPLLVIAVASGAGSLIDVARSRWGDRARFWAAVPALVLFVQWLADGASLARAHLAPSPAAALVGFLAEPRDPSHPLAQTPVITADLARLIAEGAPLARVVRVSHPAEVVPLVLAQGDRGALITTEALSQKARADLAQRGYRLRVIFAAPRSRYVDSLWTELALVLAERPSAY